MVVYRNTKSTQTCVLSAGSRSAVFLILDVSWLYLVLHSVTIEAILNCITYIGNRTVKLLRIKCENHLKGCEWIGKFQSRQEHLDKCDFMAIPCLNKCKDKTGKPVLVLRKDADDHLSNECPRRQYKCPYCAEVGEYCVITTQHFNQCPNVMVPCPNKGCDQQMLRSSTMNHVKECLFQTVSCKYANIGCEVKTLRKDLIEHEKDGSCHIELALGKVYKQQEALIELQSTLSLALSRLSTLERLQPIRGGQHDLSQQTSATFSFKFTTFSKYKALDCAVYTSPVYTNPGGYKMCFRVDANGNGFGVDSHISVFAFLMRGQNDNHLPWPFTGKATVVLLNQLRDKNHCFDVIDFSELNTSSEVRNRVLCDERAPTGYGIYTFIPHSALQYDPGKKCQFLKDDCLYFEFRMSIDNLDSKPWLSPSVTPLYCTTT